MLSRTLRVTEIVKMAKELIPIQKGTVMRGHGLKEKRMDFLKLFIRAAPDLRETL